MTAVTTDQPTVYLVIGETGIASAIAFQTDGEILETVDWTADGKPDWSEAGLCDDRGGGGREGFAALARALEAAETNAKLIGFDPVKRVPREDEDMR